jgi:ABC-type nitrate/sulfonate/bicarbonate transport system permease component
MNKLVTAILAVLAGLVAYPSLPAPTPSQVIKSRWGEFEQQNLLDQVQMLITLQERDEKS